jgi:hypothetical protein
MVEPARQKYEQLRTPTRIQAAKVLSNGDIAIIRNGGVAILRGDHIELVGGPLVGGLSFVRNGGDRLIIFSNGTSRLSAIGAASEPAIITMGDVIGEQSIASIPIGPAQGASALILDDQRTIVFGNPVTLLRGGGEPTTLPLPIANPFGGVLGPTEDSILVVGGDVELVLLTPSASSDFMEP